MLFEESKQAGFICLYCITWKDSHLVTVRASVSYSSQSISQQNKPLNHKGSSQDPSIVLDMLYLKVQLTSCGLVFIYIQTARAKICEWCGD